MRVGLLSASDWANFQYNLEQSLVVNKVDVVSYKLEPHPFGYEKQTELIKVNDIRDKFKDCDVVILIHSDWELLTYLDNKLIIPYHTGTKYRQGYKEINEKFNSPISLIALPEFQFTAPDFKYLVGAIDTDNLQPTGTCSTPIKFGHYPSNKDVKGSSEIVSTMVQLPVSFSYSFDRVQYKEQIERIKAIDVYIELMASEQGGKPYGSFGITCLEAAALGKIIITQNVNDNGLYNDNYDIPMLNFINNRDDLRKLVIGLDNYSDSHILGQQMLTRNWVVNNHSYEATGKRLIKILNGL